jgi:hypothetical protein
VAADSRNKCCERQKRTSRDVGVIEDADTARQYVRATFLRWWIVGNTGSRIEGSSLRVED